MGPRDFGTPGRNRGGPDIALRVGLERAVVWDMLDLRNLMEIPRRGQQMAGDPGHEFWMGGRNKLCHFPGGRHTAPRTQTHMHPLPLASQRGPSPETRYPQRALFPVSPSSPQGPRDGSARDQEGHGGEAWRAEKVATVLKGVG